MSEDVFEPTYSPRKIEFWLEHWAELETLALSPKASAHMAEHLNREWFLLQPRMKSCLCREIHAIDTRVDPACSHEARGGGGYGAGSETILCVLADLTKASEQLPSNWFATHKIWQQQLLPMSVIERRSRQWERREREPLFARHIAIRRMALSLGWHPHIDVAAVAA